MEEQRFGYAFLANDSVTKFHSTKFLSQTQLVNEANGKCFEKERFNIEPANSGFPFAPFTIFTQFILKIAFDNIGTDEPIFDRLFSVAVLLPRINRWYQ